MELMEFMEIDIVKLNRENIFQIIDLLEYSNEGYGSLNEEISDFNDSEISYFCLRDGQAFAFCRSFKKSATSAYVHFYINEFPAENLLAAIKEMFQRLLDELLTSSISEVYLDLKDKASSSICVNLLTGYFGFTIQKSSYAWLMTKHRTIDSNNIVNGTFEWATEKLSVDEVERIADLMRILAPHYTADMAVDNIHKKQNIIIHRDTLTRCINGVLQFYWQNSNSKNDEVIVVIDMIFVDKNLQGRGIGAELLEGAINMCCNKYLSKDNANVSTVTFKSEILETNFASQRIHDKNGFIMGGNKIIKIMKSNTRNTSY